MSILDWIDVGKTSAERDNNLDEYFYDNGITQSVIENPSAFLVLGRKGAGKTAVFRHLEQNQQKFLRPSDILVSLTFEDYNWNIHSLLERPESARSLAYKQSWRLVILVEAVKGLIERAERDNQSLTKELLEAKRLLEKLFESPIPKLTQIIGKKLLSLCSIKLPKAAVTGHTSSGSIEAGGGEMTFDKVKSDGRLREALSQNVDNLAAHLERAITSAQSLDCKVYVCFDRVDEAWENESVDISKRVIAGLVTAADALLSKHGANLRPIVFLREDIFETLSLNDANKFREDCGALLHWNRDSLFKLLLTRINYFAEKHGVAKIGNIDELFDRKTMRQRQKPSAYLLKRTMMRPRDLICFASKVINIMKEQADDSFEEAPPSPPEELAVKAIYTAESSYSEWLRKEIIDEWGAQFPEISNLLEILQNAGRTNIQRDTIERELEGPMLAATTTEKKNRLIRFMFDNSIIGIKVGDENKWRFKCVYPSQGITYTEEFHIHDGLTRSLNLKEHRERQPEQE